MRCASNTVRFSTLRRVRVLHHRHQGPCHDDDLNWPANFTSRYKTTGRLLGVGMQGMVLEAIDRQSGQRFAVKKLRKDSTAEDSWRVLNRLAAEAAALERLKHTSGVVHLVDKFEDDVFAYLVLEMMEGGTLADAIKVHPERWMDEYNCSPGKMVAL